MTKSLDCPHCGAGVLVYKGGKAKMRTSILVVHKANGEVESNCPSCKKPLILPMTMDPKKSLETVSYTHLTLPTTPYV